MGQIIIACDQGVGLSVKYGYQRIFHAIDYIYNRQITRLTEKKDEIYLPLVVVLGPTGSCGSAHQQPSFLRATADSFKYFDLYAILLTLMLG